MGGGGAGGGGGAVVPTYEGPLTRSGQTSCTFYSGGWLVDGACSQSYSAGSATLPLGQDAHHQDLLLPPAMTLTDSGATVTDANSDLIWQRCAAGQTGSGCSGTPTPYTWADANAYCGSLSINGNSSWFLPFVEDFASQYHYGFAPFLDPTLFPNAAGIDLFWTATTVEGSAGRHWVRWPYGDFTHEPDSVPSAVRCVSGDIIPFPTFQDQGDGTLLCANKDLQWLRCPLQTVTSSPQVDTTPGCINSGTAAWPTGIAACEALDFAGHSDWRLPSIRELATTNHLYQPPPAQNAAFPGTPTTSFWSSTTGTPAGAAVSIELHGDGRVQANNAKEGLFHVRCVRIP